LSGTGINGGHILLAAALIAAAIIFRGGVNPQPAPVPPQPAPALSLAEAFATNDNRIEAQADARIFSDLCLFMATTIAMDGQRNESAILKTGIALDDFRRWSRIFRLSGGSFSTKYPGLGKAIDSHLTRTVGVDPGSLTPEIRNKWVMAFRELSLAAEAVR
jgi:hypothetical protein